MSADGILFKSFGTDVFSGSTPEPAGKAAVGVAAAEGYMLLMIRDADGSCLTAAINNEVWNRLMLRAAEIVEHTFGGTIILPPPPTITLN